MNKNADNWEAIYCQKKAGNYLMYPSEHLVSLFFQNKSVINLEGNCLDFGFGSANNSEFLIQQMGQLYGLEIAESSLQIAQARLSRFERFDSSNFKLSTDAIDFDNQSFDLIVAWQVLCYNDKNGLINTIAKLRDYLKPDGTLICTLTTHNDVKVKHAKLIDVNTYEVDYRIPHQEGCMVYSPKSKDELLTLFNAFEVIDIGHYERSSYCTDNAISEYYLVLKK